MRPVRASAAVLAACAALAGGSAAAQVRLETSDDVLALCRQLPEHVPAPDVAYEPGVDVHGRPVAPADLGVGARLALPETYAVEITVDTDDRFGIPSDAARFQGEVQVGTVTVGPDGRALFNGQPVVARQDALLGVLCRRLEP